MNAVRSTLDRHSARHAASRGIQTLVKKYSLSREELEQAADVAFLTTINAQSAQLVDDAYLIEVQYGNSANSGADEFDEDGLPTEMTRTIAWFSSLYWSHH